MKHVFLFLAIFTLSFFSFSQTKPKGENLINYNKLKYLNVNKEYGNVTTSIDIKGESEYLFETNFTPKFIYKASTKIPIFTKSYKKGTVFLLSFKAKTIKSSLETGEAKLLTLFKQLDNHKGNISSTQSISSSWQTYYIPFETNKIINKKNLAIVFQYGYKPQSFLIKNIKFEVFPLGTNSKDLPKTKVKYLGMEADALWRKEALKRIEAVRKGNFTVELYKDGKSLKNKKIGIKLIKHLFPFGARMASKDIVNNTDDYKNFKKGFNSLVLGNDLKIKHWHKSKNRTIT